MMFFLKYLRVTVAAVIFCAIFTLFLDFTGSVPRTLHWIAHLQITPAILINDYGTFFQIGIQILAVWFVLTLIFGRIYCSALCPFGIMQDIFSRMARLMRGKKFKFKFCAEMTKTRYVLLAVFLFSLFFLPITVSLLDPYSHFGRITTWIFRPIFLAGNNFLAGTGSNSFYYISNIIDIPSFLTAFVVLLFAGSLSLFFGRRYCNVICPVGTLLGLIAKFSWFKIRLKSSCKSCGLCERVCKGECIDSKNKTVDSSRCVACFNCLSVCRFGALGYHDLLQIHSNESSTPPETTRQAAFVPISVQIKKPRRHFLQWSIFSLFLPSALSSAKTLQSATSPDPSLPSGTSRIGYKKTTAILPPGAGERTRFHKKCTACHLCVSKCPANVLTPSITELGLAGFLQPVAGFEHGFCNYDCVICTELCPSRALVKIEDIEEKHRLRIGLAHFLKENCVVETAGTNCGACAEHCPTGAIQMVPFGDPKKSLTIPEVDSELCIGCGGCEYICPIRPYRAIYVDGLNKHEVAKAAYDPNAKQQEVKLESFGF